MKKGKKEEEEVSVRKNGDKEDHCIREKGEEQEK